jgi:hypothetical protein
MKANEHNHEDNSEFDYTCKCNNCGEILIDENYDSKIQTENELDGTEMNMVQVEEDGEFFWACPTCGTDEYLMDN